MKKFLLGLAGVIALAAPASAADLAARPYAKAPAMIATVYDWSGFYIGANGGWGSSRKCWDNLTAAGTLVANEGCHNATGGVAGGQIGYRFQSGAWVFGVEGQGDWADLKGRNISTAFGVNTNEFPRQRVRPVDRPGRLCRQQRPALRQGRRRGHRRQLPRVRHWYQRLPPMSSATPAGAAPLA